MPRVARAIVTGCPHHVMDRGNGRMTLFHKPADYDAFCRVLNEGLSRYAVDLFPFCLKPNHGHFFLQRVSSHTRDGHLYQRRFKPFSVAKGPYFRSVAHKIEAGVSRAELCDRVEYGAG